MNRTLRQTRNPAQLPPPHWRMQALGLACGLVLMMAVASLQAPSSHGAGPSHPAQDDTAPAAPTELLQRLPFDILTLVDNTQFEIEPISPRPLPAYDASKEKRALPKGRLGESGKQQTQPETEESPDEVVIHLMSGDQRDYKVRRSNIKSILYFEDMLLAEGEKFVRARNFPKAFEYFLAVQTRNPNWKGLSERVDRLLFEEGTWALAGNERDRGMRLLRELYDRNPNYEGLRTRLAEAYGARVQEALDRGLFAYGRRVLHELREIDPTSILARDLEQRYQDRAAQALARGQAATGGERLDLLTDALRIWPNLEDAVAPYEEAFRASPTLRVGVIDLPRPVAPWVSAPASARVWPLIYLPVLVDDEEDAQIGKRTGQLAANVELGDLGRRIDLTLKRGVLWSDESRQVTAIDVVRSLSDRAQPRSPSYQARWAALLDRIETLDTDRISIRLARTPLEPLAWLIVPVGPAHAAWDGRVATPRGRLPVGNGPFMFASQDDHQTLYTALSSTSATNREVVPSPRIARLREVRLPDAGASMAALAQGDIDMVEHVAADRVPGVMRQPDYVVCRYRLPSLHRLAVDGRNPVLANRNFRRALSYALNRQALLEENVLRRPIDAANLPSDGVFAVDSYANAPAVAPLEHDVLMAKMLVAGVRREMALAKIQLTLEYPAQPEAAAAAPKIADQLRAIGLQIDLVMRPESELEASLRSGRRFDLAYRISKCDEPLRDVGTLICPAYDAPTETNGIGAIASPRMVQLLLQLEHTPDWFAARDLVTQIDRECRDELPIIPLWQLEDHFVFRKHLRGPTDTADYLYQGIEQWEIEPWFAKDPW